MWVVLVYRPENAYFPEGAHLIEPFMGIEAIGHPWFRREEAERRMQLLEGEHPEWKFFVVQATDA